MNRFKINPKINFYHILEPTGTLLELCSGTVLNYLINNNIYNNITIRFQKNAIEYYRTHTHIIIHTHIIYYPGYSIGFFWNFWNFDDFDSITNLK